MEIEKKDGKVITTMSFSEGFFAYDDPDLSKEIINRLYEIISYPSRPKKLSERDYKYADKGQDYEDGVS